MRIGVIGAGQVGAACAYACALRGVGSSLVLVDRDPDLAAAQAEDILHAAPFAAGLPVEAGDFDALEGARVVMIAAGVPQRDASESRLDLLKRNADVFRAVVPEALARAPGAALLIASNPVDVMTDLSARIAARLGAPAARIMGSGTMLDTARLRAEIGLRLGVSAKSVHAYVLGEHGDSEVLCWSGAEVGGVPLEAAAAQLGRPLDAAARAGIDARVRRAAYRIIAGKGATWFGIGAAMARLAEAVIADQRAALTVTAREEGEGPAAHSLPRLIGAGGVIAKLEPRLSDVERTALARSAAVVAEAAGALEA